jgi:hypothetical protein
VVRVGSVGDAPLREPVIVRDFDWGVSETVEVNSSLADSDSVKMREMVLDGWKDKLMELLICETVCVFVGVGAGVIV